MTLFILSPGWLEITHIETLHHIASLTFLYQDYCFLNKFYFVNFSPLVSRHCNLTCIVSTLFCWKTQIVKVLYKWPVFSFPQLEFQWADRILFHLNFLKNSQLKGRGQARLLCHYIWWHSTSSRNHLEMNLSFFSSWIFFFHFPVLCCPGSHIWMSVRVLFEPERINQSLGENKFLFCPL